MSRKRRTIPDSVRRKILEQFGYQCAYCRAPDRLLSVALTIDHIVPINQGGTDSPDNLCAACRHCNEAKHQHTHGIDPQTGEATPLFHPQRQRWSEHFEWAPDGVHLVGKTAIGRITIEILQLNNERRIYLRTLWKRLGLHPPPE